MKAGPILTALGELDAQLGDTRHPLLGRGSVHASLISGGNDLATYPERCTIGIERRTLPGEGAAEVERELAHLLSGCREADPVLEASARTLLVREPLETAEDEARRGRAARGGGRAARLAAAALGSELLGRLRLHCRGRHPDCAVRTSAARARMRPRNGSASATRRAARAC